MDLNWKGYLIVYGGSLVFWYIILRLFVFVPSVPNVGVALAAAFCGLVTGVCIDIAIRTVRGNK